MTPEPSLTVRHAAGSYPIYIERGVLAALPALAARHCPGRRLAVVADSRVAECVSCPLDAPVLIFPAGEASKSREVWSRLVDRLLDLGFSRDSAIVALGGGVTGDLAGFVAATFQRGVPILQVPTTLLAMVDASIGGKTAIDTPAGKNLIGAFHQPAAVVMDPETLGTLPAEELRAGLAEAIKHALIADAAHFAWLRGAMPKIVARDSEALDRLIRASAAIKAAIVEADERDTGRRATLNAGHTVGHAIEAATEWRIRHGDAVAIGMVVEAVAAEELAVAEPGTADAVRTLVRAADLPTALPDDVAPEAVITAAYRDKKNVRGAIRCALPARIGAIGSADGSWTTAVPATMLEKALADRK